MAPVKSGNSSQRFRLLSGAVLAVIAVGISAIIDADASELRVAWDHCGANGTASKSFACDSDAGTDTLVVSYQASFDFPKLVHADIFMSVCFRQLGPIPDWWQVLGSGACRLGALSVTGANPVESCASIWDPVSGSTQSISARPCPACTLNGFVFDVSVSARDTARARDIVAGQEYELVRLVLDHSRTTGLGACTGCTIGADVSAWFVWLYTTDGRSLGTSLGGYATWQDPALVCNAISPVRNTTWGALKSLYR